MEPDGEDYGGYGKQSFSNHQHSGVQGCDDYQYQQNPNTATSGGPSDTIDLSLSLMLPKHHQSSDSVPRSIRSNGGTACFRNSVDNGCENPGRASSYRSAQQEHLTGNEPSYFTGKKS